MYIIHYIYIPLPNSQLTPSRTPPMTIIQYKHDLTKFRITYEEMRNPKATLAAISKELRRLYLAGDLTGGSVMCIKLWWFSDDMTAALVKIVARYFDWVGVYNRRRKRYEIAGGGAPNWRQYIGEEVYAETHKSAL